MKPQAPARGYNHPHWDHGAVDETPATEGPRRARLHHWLRRVHLPAHPLAPLALIALGVAHCVLILSLLDAETVMEGMYFTTLAVLGFAIVPGVALIGTGAADLGRRAWQHLARRRESHV